MNAGAFEFKSQEYIKKSKPRNHPMLDNESDSFVELIFSRE